MGLDDQRIVHLLSRQPLRRQRQGWKIGRIDRRSGALAERHQADRRLHGGIDV